jgi:aspartyl protease family protein
MLGRVIFVVILAVAAALAGSFSLLGRLSAPAPVSAAPASVAEAPAEAAGAASPAPPEPQSSGYREAALQADSRGQYAAGVLIDGIPVQMLVDTGASYVAVSAATAKRLGLSASGERRYTVKTANGPATAFPTILSTVSLDGLYMNDVEALIMTPEAGDVNLLGASFLKRLISVEQRGGMLILRQ